jgi:hypothetical protein
VNQYEYGGVSRLSPERLFFWVLVDKTEEQFGLHDLEAVVAIISGQPLLSTRGKFVGATPGTSLASLAARKALNVDLPFRLPMLTGGTVRTLRIAFTKNLGAFVGRAIPIVGYVMLASDAFEIMWKTVSTYNKIVRPEDRVF